HTLEEWYNRTRLHRDEIVALYDERFYRMWEFYLAGAEQAFRYGAPICAGDVITLRSKIVDIYDKKGGALEFIVTDCSATNQDGEDVGGMTRSAVVRT
ncbi:MAG: FAS1-like dehydratase domain-containing protein, partial [Albimonas sp.]|uniref:FAS1-like dehydratase domain-containing protein n=1 Tax=Albimonas sp. TaxID=1872425 RepID=UPI00405735F5